MTKTCVSSLTSRIFCLVLLLFTCSVSSAQDAGMVAAFESAQGAEPGAAFENAGFVVTAPQEMYYTPAHCYGLIADAVWLNWRTSHSNQTYANFSDPVWLTGRSSLNINPKGNGIRTRLGFRGANGWDVSWIYTYFNGDNSAVQDASYDPSSAMTSPLSCLNLGIDDVSVSSDSRLNVHDLEFGRWVGFGEGSVDIRPFASIRYAALEENLEGQYHYRDTLRNERLNDYRHSSDMKGYGLRVGCETELNLCSRLSAFGRGAGSVLVGETESASFEQDEIQGTVLNRQLSETRAVPVIEVSAGLAWKWDSLEIKGGYEVSSWFNASSLNNESSDVLFHGIFAGGSWNY